MGHRFWREQIYVDGYNSRKNNQIRVVERINGQRVYRTFTTQHTLYYEHAGGSSKTIFGQNCQKFVTEDEKKFKRQIDTFLGIFDPKKKRKIFESDINPVFRCLADNYQNSGTPSLNIAFFDIETALYPERGYAPPSDPFADITGITIYLKWLDKLVTLALCPPTMNIDVCRESVKDIPDTYVFDEETELLQTFIALIDDADVLSGWNSEGFDIPYTINRIIKLLGPNATRDLCLWGERPRERIMQQFKREVQTYDLVGRVHLDYLALYRKHNTQQLHSYRLGYVGEIEVGETKVAYTGNLDDLWKKDFVKFVDYNRQDVMLLQKIDEKKKFIELANQVAHANCVLLKTTMGSVALVEQAIINAMHDMGFVVPDRKRTLEERGEIELAIEDVEDNDEALDDDEDDIDEKNPVAGAYVADPKKGLHDYIACCDINSLYPSAIRALNMSAETIVGQFIDEFTVAFIEGRVKTLGKNKRAEAWAGIFGSLEYTDVIERTDRELSFRFEDGRVIVKSAAEWHNYIFNPANKLCLTANGTVFTTERDGMIPLLLAKWYGERKQMQAMEAGFTFINERKLVLDQELTRSVSLLLIDNREHPEVFLSDRQIEQLQQEGVIRGLRQIVEAKDAEKIALIMNAVGAVLDGNTIAPRDDEVRKRIKGLEIFWNQRQQARKILLNSLYGALLNEGLRFYDARLGQSTTLSGRIIARHMNAKINEAITGEYDHKGEAIIYADTDSSYFSAFEALKDKPGYENVSWSRESVLALSDEIAEQANASFPNFMMEAFNTSHERGSIIKAGRELCASKGLFIKKKKYALMMYEKEGVRLDSGNKPGKLKAMGLDLKRADTPKPMQAFLEKLLTNILTGESKTISYEQIKLFRDTFRDQDDWLKGSPKKVSALTDFQQREEQANTARLTETLKRGDTGKINMPGHVRASINWNLMCEANQDRYSDRIGDGSKIVVCKLLPNAMKMDSIAYPIDLVHIPDWFKQMPFDRAEMENVIIDKKVLNLVAVLEWDLSETRGSDDDEFFAFD